MPIAIRYLKISNYRSIDELELHDIPAFAVFAGANGSGKSNFFNALDFVRLVLRFDVKEALQRHGGWENIRCVISEPLLLDGGWENSRCINDSFHENTFLVETTDDKIQVDNLSSYFTEVKSVWENEFRNYIENHIKIGESWCERINELYGRFKSEKQEAWKLFLNLRLFRIEPRDIKESNTSIHDDSELQRYGQNLAAVLRRLEKDDEVRETIIDWLQLIVPQLEIVQTEAERLSGSAQLAFKEKGTDKLFPAHLISDGTIYLLCLLVAMLDRPKTGITLIEEPERGLHPKAIMELVKGFREHATIESPIWLTTHSESVVRMLKDNELWLVDKKDGKTQINPVRNIENLQLNLDEAWLSNALNGGLPW